MPTKFVNITSATTTSVTTPGVGNGDFELRITNNHTSESVVSVYITDGTSDFYLIKNLAIPPSAAVLIDNTMHQTQNSLAEGGGMQLKIQTHSSTTNITIIQIQKPY